MNHVIPSYQILYQNKMSTRSQAVARIANRTALRNSTFGGHVTIWYPTYHFLLVVLWNQASISNGFRDIQCRMSRNGWHNHDTTKKQMLRSFILVPIDFSHTTSYKLSIVTFAIGRTV